MIHVLLLLALAWGAASLILLGINLAATPRLSHVGPRTGRFPSVSVVIPARNEERSVEAAVRSHLAQEYPDFEVIVVEDRSADRTGEILTRLARENPRLTVFPGSDPPPGWLGKPHALWLGAQQARGRVLLLADADVVYHPKALAEAVTLMEETGADLIAVLPRFEARGFWENVLMPFVPTAYYLGAGFLLNRDRPRWIGSGAGAGSLVRRAVYDAVRGHEALKDSVIDDVRLGLNVRRAGYRTRAVRAEDRISVRMYYGFREVVVGFTKNLAYVFEGVLGVAMGALSVLTVLVGLAPVVALAGALGGASISSSDLLIAAAAYGLAVLARLAMGRALKDPLWPAFLHPISSAVWAGIIGRSLFHRIIRRRLTWRGREFDARAARF